MPTYKREIAYWIRKVPSLCARHSTSGLHNRRPAVSFELRHARRPHASLFFDHWRLLKTKVYDSWVSKPFWSRLSSIYVVC